jgi:hypothetical protein
MGHQSTETHPATQKPRTLSNPASWQFMAVVAYGLMGDGRDSGTRSNRPRHSFTRKWLNIPSGIAYEKDSMTRNWSGLARERWGSYPF